MFVLCSSSCGRRSCAADYLCGCERRPSFVVLPVACKLNLRLQLDARIRSRTSDCTLCTNSITWAARAAPAPPGLMMKFACTSLICTPPTAAPFIPAASIKRPAWSPVGFMNVLPRLASTGCVRRRWARYSSARLRRTSASSSTRRKRASRITGLKPACSGRSRFSRCFDRRSPCPPAYARQSHRSP